MLVCTRSTKYMCIYLQIHRKILPPVSVTPGVTVTPHSHVIHTRISLANAKTLNILLDRSKSGQTHPTADAKLPQQFWPHTHLDSDDS